MCPGRAALRELEQGWRSTGPEEPATGFNLDVVVDSAGSCRAVSALHPNQAEPLLPAAAVGI